jgi:hypothetical protein
LASGVEASSSMAVVKFGGSNWPMTSLAALQHHTRFWGNSRHRAAADPEIAWTGPCRVGYAAFVLELGDEVIGPMVNRPVIVQAKRTRGGR